MTLVLSQTGPTFAKSQISDQDQTKMAKHGLFMSLSSNCTWYHASCHFGRGNGVVQQLPLSELSQLMFVCLAKQVQI
jgi:Fe-S oxidoreductase